MTPKYYTLDELVIELTKFDITDWEAISTVDFLKHLKNVEREEMALQEEMMDHSDETEIPMEYQPDMEAI